MNVPWGPGDQEPGRRPVGCNCVQEPNKLPRPLQDRILVRQDPPKEKIGHIIIPDSVGKDYPSTGTVLRIGPKVTVDTCDAGDRVIFRRRPDSALVPDDREPGQAELWKNLLMLREDDIMAVIVDGEVEVQS